MELNILTPLGYIPNEEQIVIARNIQKTMIFLERNIIVTIYESHIYFQVVGLIHTKEIIKALEDNSVNVNKIDINCSNNYTTFKYLYNGKAGLSIDNT